MAGETYYYLFSLILVSVVALYIVNLARIRRSGRTTFGFGFSPGSVEYKRLQEFASKRKLVVAILLEAFLVIGVFDSVIKILRLNTADARFVLIFGPCFVAIFICIGILFVRKSFRDLKLPHKRKDK